MHCTERKYLNSCIISTDYNKIIGNFNITIILSIYYTCISQYYIISRHSRCSVPWRQYLYFEKNRFLQIISSHNMQQFTRSDYYQHFGYLTDSIIILLVSCYIFIEQILTYFSSRNNFVYTYNNNNTRLTQFIVPSLDFLYTILMINLVSFDRKIVGFSQNVMVVACMKQNHIRKVHIQRYRIICVIQLYGQHLLFNL